MRVPMQEHVDIFRRVLRRNVHEPEADPVSFQIDNERPFKIAVAISAYDCYRRTDGLQRLQNTRRANIAEMPDFIRAAGKRLNIRRQMIMRVRQNKNANWQRHSESSHKPR